MWKELKKLGLRVDDEWYNSGSITLHIRSNRKSSACPSCGRRSLRVHSQYRRQLTDLPAHGCRVTLRLNVRKFHCDNPTCSKQIFSERFPGLVLPHRRTTVRLEALWTRLGLFLGGEGGARLAHDVHAPTSADTILRLVHRIDLTPMRDLRVIGIDEWAWRKGQRYGVILSDHISGRPVDLLAECTREAVIEHLKEHANLEVITRDRSELFADAARQAVPKAVQVADRWHLIKNIGDLVDEILGVTSVSIPVIKGQQKLPDCGTPKKIDAQVNRSEKTSKTLAQQRREERYHLIRELYAELKSIRAVAKHLKISRATVRKYLQANECPTHRPRSRRSQKLQPYLSYLERRWKEGCRNAFRLYRELVQAGYDGSSSLVRAFVRRWRVDETAETPQADSVAQRRVQLSPRRLRRLFCSDADALSEAERQQLEAVLEQDSRAPEVYAWIQEFRRILQERDVDGFFRWLDQAKQSSIRRIRGFAEFMRRDVDSVVAAIELPWSNGRVEGHINRLKLLKRQMYGRAGIELLRRRFLLT